MENWQSGGAIGGCKAKGKTPPRKIMVQQNSVRSELSEPSTSHALEWVRTDRCTPSKSEEDSRRRTIIVEKVEGSFGFTIQSYGIHYKKEQEIEMISYVDSIDFNGPAAKAGMREGDVILSINGTDMENADHSTLINFIKHCETRMRMVVLFEDCVRKVELHRRYLEIQRNIQEREEEFKRLEILEREILQGKWKTHSLPSKSKMNKDKGDSDMGSDNFTITYCRPTTSSEDVTNKNKLLQEKTINAQYLQLHNDSITSLRNDDINVTYIINKRDHQQKNISRDTREENESQQNVKKCTKGRTCYPCRQTRECNIEAYDLASPCCEPHCVPRKHHHRKEHKEKRCSGERSKTKKNSKMVSNVTILHYADLDRALNRQQSCNSSEASVTVTACDSSNSYTTSLSSDTLFWDGVTCTPKVQQGTQTKSHHSHHFKPKSCENFTTKAFGGYGFGYGYSSKDLNKTFMRSNSANKATNTNVNDMNLQVQQVYNKKQIKCNVPTKSTESLLVENEYQESNKSDPSISCDCLNFMTPDTASRLADRVLARETRRLFINPPNMNEIGYYSHIPRTQITLKSIRKKRSNSAEITRL